MYKDVHCSTALGIEGAAQLFRRNGVTAEPRKARRSAYTTAIYGWLNMRKPERPYNNV